MGNFSCPECDGRCGEVGECLGKLIWITCTTCDGHGIIAWDDETDWEGHDDGTDDESI